MIHWIQICHAPSRVIDASRRQIVGTIEDSDWLIDKFTFLDNRYPAEDMTLYLQKWATNSGGGLLVAEKNLGGHGGFSAVISHLQPKDEDLIFGVDPDSFPLTKGWIKACVSVMRANPDLGAVSLMPVQCVERGWKIEETPFFPRVGFLTGPEMYGVTCWRGKALKEGLLADSDFYGFVETAMWRHFKKLNLRHGYLMDYLEGVNPVPHDTDYVEWKRMHAMEGYKPNFDEYLREQRAGL